MRTCEERTHTKHLNKMITAMQWIRKQESTICEFNRIAEATQTNSSVESLLAVLRLRDSAARLNIGFQLEQVEGLIKARAIEARNRILQRAFNAICAW